MSALPLAAAFAHAVLLYVIFFCASLYSNIPAYFHVYILLTFFFEWHARLDLWVCLSVFLCVQVFLVGESKASVLFSSAVFGLFSVVTALLDVSFQCECIFWSGCPFENKKMSMFWTKEKNSRQILSVFIKI